MNEQNATANYDDVTRTTNRYFGRHFGPYLARPVWTDYYSRPQHDPYNAGGLGQGMRGPCRPQIHNNDTRPINVLNVYKTFMYNLRRLLPSLMTTRIILFYSLSSYTAFNTKISIKQTQ